jgi:hypothetical protein
MALSHPGEAGGERASINSRKRTQVNGKEAVMK